MDTGRVTAECDVAGEFVDLVAQGEAGAPPRLQRAGSVTLLVEQIRGLHAHKSRFPIR